MAISFYGGEATGSVGNRTVETAKQETTGGVGVKKNQDSIFNIDNDLKQDTVSFRANNQSEQKTSTAGIVAGSILGIAAAIGLMGIAHKQDWVGKISNEKVQKLFRHTDKVTEPCHKACAWVKQNCYDKVINFFHKK